ncbi:MAG: histidinol phosphate phosphatase [Deltaproteobacteria bacterium]|nr:histidinol phosphate phosphatase [Deltaproteobacteria bacterium]MBW2419241.1 histidinol phosphate phosphatase [Deltaproteobacteria bacterium]
MKPETLEEAARVASAACDAARREILPRFRSVAVETKADGSPVTEADRAAERAIRAVLREAFPDFAILGEEYGEEAGASAEGTGPKWVIDPIDGTIAYSRGIPLFSTIIALLDEGEPVLGLIDLPALDERMLGWKDGGCRLNGHPVRVSQEKELSRALVSHGDPMCFDQAGQRPAFERMAREIPMLRGYTDAFGHVQVLSGAVDAMVDVDLNPWDAAATQVLAGEAGGSCVARKRARGKIDLVFGSPALVEQLAAFLSG